MEEIRDMTKADLEDAIALWKSIPELRFQAAFDTDKKIARFLLKNPGLSSAAFCG